MIKDVNLIINRLKDNLKMIENLSSFNNLNNMNAKKTRQIGKKIDKDIKLLLSNDDGISNYSEWLLSKDYDLMWNAALNLFPIYPNKCIEILNNCLINTKDELKKSLM